MCLAGQDEFALMRLLYDTGVLEKTDRKWLEAAFPQGFLQEMVMVRCYFPGLSKEWMNEVFPLGLWHYAKTVPECCNPNWITWYVLDGEADDGIEWEKKEEEAEAMIAALQLDES